MLRLLESGRGWVKLCAYRCDLEGAPFRGVIPFVRALEAAAPERLVWGTDWPHPNLPERTPGVPMRMPDDGDLVDALGAWFEDAAALERVLVANPARLYGFGESLLSPPQRWPPSPARAMSSPCLGLMPARQRRGRAIASSGRRRRWRRTCSASGRR